ncbi:MAG: thiamine ABC transporter substrate-binding protein [Asgard group archaeon]|nr:thiamine ABC transporter substrate-binding protein [Asgard group archaeon]
MNLMINKKGLCGIIILALITIMPFYIPITKSCWTSGRISPKIIDTLVFNPSANGELVIYTHESFMAWGEPADYDFIMNQTFHNFGLIHDVTVRVQIFSGMVDALNVLISQKNNPQADVVIGLDNTMVSQAKSEGIIKPLTSGINLENISSDIISGLDPEKYLVPIDFGLIALIFDTEFITTTSYPELLELNFTSLIEIFGEDLVVQDPTQSATGLNFLLYQIVFFEEILGQNWEDWWLEAKDVVSIDKSWSDSWDRVFSQKEDHIMVSYGTDPAYNAYFGYSFEQNAAIIHHESEQYGWLQIEGIGIVEGTSQEALAKDYINYALSSEVQDYIATNNWMFPANNQTILPPCYDYAITTENVSVLNNLITPNYLGENYQSWLNTWERLIFGSEYWWLWILIPGCVILLGTIIIITIRSRTKIEVE